MAIFRSIFRVLSISLLTAFTATVAAQAAPEKTASTVQTEETFATTRIGDHRQRSNPFVVDQAQSLAYLSPDEMLCLKLRTYKVARDTPHSDSTHAAGYSTCQPAARFQMHTAEFKLSPTGSPSR